MTEPRHSCESCGMTVGSGPYCGHCLDTEGELQDFDLRLDRMIEFMQQHDARISRGEAEERALAYMATMPAWRDHPRVVGRG